MAATLGRIYSHSHPKGWKPPCQLQVNGILLPARSFSPIPTGMSPRTQKCVTNVFSFDTQTHDNRIREVWSSQCVYVIKEVLTTERAYVEALGDVIKVSLVIGR